MRIYLSKSFHRNAEHDGVTDDDCREAIRKAERGLVDADLGGGLIKQRITEGRPKGRERSSSTNGGELALFLHIFLKSRKASLTKSELREYLKLARVLEGLTEATLTELVAKEGWRELEL